MLYCIVILISDLTRTVGFVYYSKVCVFILKYGNPPTLHGCCLSPLLYILYTNGCQSLYTIRHIIESAGDSVIVYGSRNRVVVL